jgi:hypothetical protein
MFGLLFALSGAATDCEICQNGVDYAYLCYLIYGYDTASGQQALDKWCGIAYPDQLDRCRTICVDNYPEWVQLFEASYPQSYICPDYGYCPKDAKRARRVVRPQKVDADYYGLFFDFLKTAKSEQQLRNLIRNPGKFADLSKLLSEKDIPIVFKLLKADARRTFSWFVKEKAR